MTTAPQVIIGRRGVERLLPEYGKTFLFPHEVSYPDISSTEVNATASVPEELVKGQHFKTKPIIPGVLYTEIVAQCAAVFITKVFQENNQPYPPIYLGVFSAKVSQPSAPGVILTVKLSFPRPVLHTRRAFKVKGVISNPQGEQVASTEGTGVIMKREE